MDDDRKNIEISYLMAQIREDADQARAAGTGQAVLDALAQGVATGIDRFKSTVNYDELVAIVRDLAASELDTYECAHHDVRARAREWVEQDTTK